jgi:hypothetical protein
MRIFHVAKEATRGRNTREANKTAQGKAKGGKMARTQAKLDAQISLISMRIERADAQRSARRAKR